MFSLSDTSSLTWPDNALSHRRLSMDKTALDARSSSNEHRILLLSAKGLSPHNEDNKGRGAAGAMKALLS